MSAALIPELYEFQKVGLQAGRDLYAGRVGGVKRRAVLFVGPTGMGKTTLAAEAARGHIAKGGTVTAIAHRRELITQLAERFQRFGLEVGYLGRNSIARVQVTSIQEILATRRMPPASLVIIDEAHHYAAAEWSVAPREYLKAGALLMGLTATPERADGIGLGVDVGGIFDGLVVVAQVRDLIALNALNEKQGVTPIEIVYPKEVTRLAKAPADAYSLYAKDRYCVVFAPNVKNAERFAEDFNARKIEALVVHGQLSKDVRDERLSRFSRGDVRVLVNVAVLTEGWDAPICDSLIVARPVGSFSLLRQMIGRARRALPGKKSALYIDLASNVELHGHPDSDIDYDLTTGMSSGGRRAMPGERKCRVCGKFLGDAIAEMKTRGLELAHCPECNTKLSKIELLTPDDIALQKAKDHASLQKVPTQQRVKALATMYEAEIRKGVKGKRANAEYAYRNIFKSGFPPTEIRVAAWRLAKEKTSAA